MPSLVITFRDDHFTACGMVAFVARCLRRVFPVFRAGWCMPPPAVLDSVNEALQFVESAAANGVADQQSYGQISRRVSKAKHYVPSDQYSDICYKFLSATLDSMRSAHRLGSSSKNFARH